MQLPFCKICGENHRLGHCPLWDEPPQRKPHAKPVAREDEKIAPAVEEAWRQTWQQARPLSPEDMKQEEMPEHKPRFDRNAYQRELMRRRREQLDERQL
jgi:hypothetical protein